MNITCQNLYHMPYQPENPISPQGPPARGAMHNVIQILTCNVHYIIYFNMPLKIHVFYENFEILMKVWKNFKFWNLLGIQYSVCDIGYKRYRLGTIIDNAYTKHLYFNINIWYILIISIFFHKTRIIRTISDELEERIWYGPDNPCRVKKKY
jgi:hypothetical protein